MKKLLSVLTSVFFNTPNTCSENHVSEKPLKPNKLTEPILANIRKCASAGKNGAPIFEVYSAAGLQAFADMVNGAKTAYEIDGIKIGTTTTETLRKSNIVLQADIDLSEICGQGKGNWRPIGKNCDLSFEGTFEGNNKVVKNIYIAEHTDRIMEPDPVWDAYGLIGYAKNCEINNLTVTGRIAINNRGNNHYITAGGVVGSLHGKATNCHSSVLVKIKLRNSSGGGINAGGIVGGMCSRSILESSTSCSTISAEFNAPESNYSLFTSIGGVVGHTYESTLINCQYSSGSISARSSSFVCHVGGIVGMFRYGKMFGCANNSPMKAEATVQTQIGGLCGYTDGKSKIITNYNTGELTILEGTKTYDIGGITGFAVTPDIIACYSVGAIVDNAPQEESSYKGGISGVFSAPDSGGLAKQSWYVGNTDLGVDGIGNNYVAKANVSNCGRISYISALNSKVDEMNAAIKSYNLTAKDDEKCMFCFVSGKDKLPTLKAGAPK